jgi:NADPH2:quinone reductase
MKAQILRKLEELIWPKIEEGAVRPLLYRILPIAKAEEAHAILERNENIGKVVLQIPFRHR